MCSDHRPPEAVLMDYEMPVMNGPTATKQLREMGCGSYIIGVTGNVMKVRGSVGGLRRVVLSTKPSKHI
jgi:CheY-like chemotaxis protein